jgi:hypothetical protein
MKLFCRLVAPRKVTRPKALLPRVTPGESNANDVQWRPLMGSEFNEAGVNSVVKSELSALITGAWELTATVVDVPPATSLGSI